MSKLHLVFGGRVKDPQGLDFDLDTVDVVGVFGSYADTLVKRDGRWLFAEKINDIVAPTSLTGGWADGFGPHQPIARSS